MTGERDNHRSQARCFEEKVEFLRRPDSWPEGTKDVETVTTHFACVFLTDRHAWKLKRPIRWLGLDQRTVAARQQSCCRELALNRRLAASVYQDVVALATDDRRGLSVGGPGETVDWMVRMRRLPAALMLDSMIAGGNPPPASLDALAGVLARFYRQAPLPGGDSAQQWPETLRAKIGEQVQPGPGDSDERTRSRMHEIGDQLIAFTHDNVRLLQERAGRDCVVEGHGDLRPEHVCLEGPPVVIDCLEFDRALRTLDRADELAYLWLECEHLGNAAPGEYVLRRCLGALNDECPAALLCFYRALGAVIRARLALWHLTADGNTTRKWYERATDYLDMAEQFAREARRRG